MKKIILVLIGIILIAGGIFLKSRIHTDVETPSNLSAANEAEVKQAAWDTFQSYLAFAKAKNAKGVASFSYQTSDACTTAPEGTECQTKLEDAYKIGSALKLQNFTHATFDDKQIILTSEYKLEETDLAQGYSRDLMYFTRDANGQPKVLYFVPHLITYRLKGDNTPEGLKARLDAMIVDTDSDTLDDEVETCGYTAVDVEKCVKSDPKKKDTDGDGWWDSTELLFYKKS